MVLDIILKLMLCKCLRTISSLLWRRNKIHHKCAKIMIMKLLKETNAIIIISWMAFYVICLLFINGHSLLLPIMYVLFLPVVCCLVWLKKWLMGHLVYPKFPGTKWTKEKTWVDSHHSVNLHPYTCVIFE